MNRDVDVVAKALLVDIDEIAPSWCGIPVDHVIAMARVVIAAAERAKSGHDIDCDAALALEPDTGIKPGAPCTCGHDALAAALKGGGE